MIDRTINLISIFCIAFICAVTGYVTYDSWVSTKHWEKVWIMNKDRKPNPFDQFDDPNQVQKILEPERILSALKNAEKAFDFDAVARLKEHLESNYKPTGEVKIRFSEKDLTHILLALFISSLSLIVPLSVNYVRHAKCRLWNKNT